MIVASHARATTYRARERYVLVVKRDVLAGSLEPGDEESLLLARRGVVRLVQSSAFGGARRRGRGTVSRVRGGGKGGTRACRGFPARRREPRGASGTGDGASNSISSVALGESSHRGRTLRRPRTRSRTGPARSDSWGRARVHHPAAGPRPPRRARGRPPPPPAASCMGVLVWVFVTRGCAFSASRTVTRHWILRFRPEAPRTRHRRCAFDNVSADVFFSRKRPPRASTRARVRP